MLFVPRVYNELKFGELIKDVTELSPPTSYVMQEEDFPRIIPSCFDYNINSHWSRRYAKFYCLVLEKDNVQVCYSPSASLLGYWQTKDEKEIRTEFGQGIDTLSSKENSQIDYIIDLIKNPDEFMEHKRLEKIADPQKTDKVVLIGKGYNGIVEGKNGDKYTVFGKQLVHIKDGLPQISKFIDYITTNPLDLVTKSQYEYRRVLFNSHTFVFFCKSLENRLLAKKSKLLNKPKGRNISSIDSIFDPFNFPNLINNSNLRKTVRKALIPSILSVPYIENNIPDPNGWKKKRLFTLYRVETDAALLSQREVYNPIVLNWLNNYYNMRASVEKTKKFYGEYKAVDWAEIPAIHYFDEQNKTWIHKLGERFFRTYHGFKRLSDKELFIQTQPDQLDLLTPKKLASLNNNGFKLAEDDKTIENVIQHDENNNFNHFIKTKGKIITPDPKKYEIVHLAKIWDPDTKINHFDYRWVLKLPNDVLVYLQPFQSRKFS